MNVTSEPAAPVATLWHPAPVDEPAPTADLVAALAAAELEFDALIADAVNPHFGSRYATLGALIAATRPALSRHGLVVVQTLENRGVVELVTTLRHKSGQAIESRFPLPAWKSPQDLGSLLTYIRRYCEGAILNLATEIDDDGNATEHASRAQRAHDGRREGRNAAALRRRDNATPRAAQREIAAKQVRDDRVNAEPRSHDEHAEQLADLIDMAATTGQLDSLVPELAQLPAEYRPPLRVRFSERRNALAEIERDRRELDEAENGSD